MWIDVRAIGLPAVPEALVQAFAAAGVELRPAAATGNPPLLLLAAHMDDRLDAALAALAPRRCAVLLTGAAEVPAADAWRALRAGAADVQGSGAVAALAARFERWNAVEALVDGALVRRHLIGASSAWRAALREIVEWSRFSPAHLLVTGETGTGKELVAHAVHALDTRPEKRELVIVDCTTLSSELAGSELFGHERGAFTGAHQARDGALALADGGTLFLDEVGELPLPLQAQLLRAVQERCYRRVGSNQWRQSRFRLVCATHRDLAAEVARGSFRADLYHRLAQGLLQLPPLRERGDDVLLLARHFLQAAGHDGGVAPAVAQWLRHRPFPGNVRELAQLMTRLAARHPGPGPVCPADLPAAERPPATALRADAGPWCDAAFEQAITTALARGALLKELAQQAAEVAIRVAVEEAGGNLQRAAQRLGVTDRALQMRRARPERAERLS